MSLPVVLVLALVAMVSLVAVAAVVTQLLARLRRLTRELQDIERSVMPQVEKLQRDTDVTGRELERIGQALDELGEQRGAR